MRVGFAGECSYKDNIFSRKIGCTIGQPFVPFEMEKSQRIRAVLFYKEHFQEFFNRQREKLQHKILWTLTLIEELPRIPESYLKHIVGTDGLYEIRIQQGGDHVRLFCFFDKGNLVIVLHGFHKSSQRTPKKEISRALLLKKEYEDGKA